MAETFTPHDYQRKGIDWLIDHPRCCLFWEMGLGKSVVTLTAVSRLLGWLEVERVLVVAPKKVAETTWSAEAAKWQHLTSLQVSVVMGTPKARQRALEAPADVYVVGRDNLPWLEAQKCERFDCIVFDELTSYKSPTSLRFKAARRLASKADRVIGLTGTPAPNGLMDLWGELAVVDGGQRLGQFIGRFRDAYFNSYRINGQFTKYSLKSGSERLIRAAIADICLTMQAADYLSLPALVIEDVPVALPEAVLKGYHDFAREQVLRTLEKDPALIVAGSAAALYGKLAQYANGSVYDEEHEAHQIHTEKAQRLAEIVESADGSVLVFYQYKHDVPAIKAALKGRRVCLYEGAETLAAWNAGKIDVLLAHPQSTAYGLNMQQGGRHIVWYGLGWNLELYQQANARLHRQGQRLPVMVYNLVVPGTVDTMAAAALKGKSTTQQELIDGLKKIAEL